MKSLSVLIKPASSLCNLRCKYCFYANVSDLREIKSHGIMKEDSIKKLIENTFYILENHDEIIFAFQGGEPTLAGIEFFKSFINYVSLQNKKVKVNYTIQTNGTLLNNEWCKFLKENNFLVGLSLDLLENIHNENRIYPNNKGSYDTIVNNKQLLESYEIDFNILCVLTDQLALKPIEVFNAIREHKIKYIQFIPCLDDLDSKCRSNYALTPQNFAYFYKEILLLWAEEFYKENYISINLLDNIISLFITGNTNACGLTGICHPQFVIESDGSVYPCDFYVLDNYNLGNIKDNTLPDLLEKKAMIEFLCSNRFKYKICFNCKFYNICRGGCKRMTNSIYINTKNNYCGYYDFLDSRIDNIRDICMKILHSKSNT
ncbi:SPASM domain-containing protein [Clostridioides difficile]